ncbi:MAG: DUF4411 family protein [Pirellulales bacterium]
MTRFLLDSNVLIESNQRYYSQDFCPAFWDWLVHHNAQNAIYSIDKVYDEISGAGDNLSDWADSYRSALFMPTTAEMSSALSHIAQWVVQSRYTDNAVSEFLAAADYYLCAYALVYGYTVVTHEVSKPDHKSKVKIPDVCNAVGVEWTDIFHVLKKLRTRFELGSPE